MRKNILTLVLGLSFLMSCDIYRDCELRVDNQSDFDLVLISKNTIGNYDTVAFINRNSTVDLYNEKTREQCNNDNCASFSLYYLNQESTFIANNNLKVAKDINNSQDWTALREGSDIRKIDCGCVFIITNNDIQ